MGSSKTASKEVGARLEASLLPEQREARSTLVLDLNGTLISTSRSLKRPHVDRFLEEMSSLFELVVFTSSGQRMADFYLDDMLDPTGRLISHRIYGNACRGVIKDLSLLGRPMERVMIIDDSLKKCVLNIDNWIPVTKFRRNLDDRELLDLIPFLEGISRADDVRPAIREAFGEKVGLRRSGNFPKAVVAGDGEVKKRRINDLGRELIRLLSKRTVRRFGLELTSDGYCKVEDILRLELKTRKGFLISSHTVEEVIEAVQEHNELKTMVGEDDQLYIKGHVF